MENQSSKVGVIVVIFIIIIVAVLFLTGLIDLSGENMEDKLNNSSLSETTQQVLDNSGVEIDEQVIGVGETIAIGKLVSVHYKGTLEDGTVFDSSEGKEPLKFIYGAGQLIAGFEIGMLDMKIGGKRIVRIPSELGYGDREVGQIPANSNLIFEIEVVGIEDVSQT